MISKKFCYLIEPDYDQPEFRRLLEGIANNAYLVDLELKKDIGSTVSRTLYKNQPLVVKRYNTRSIWHAVKRAFRQSRAENCQRMSTVFNKAGIQTAPSVAIIQEWFGPIKLRSWFICEYIDGEMLLSYIEKKKETTLMPFIPDWMENGVVELFEKLQQQHLSHGDLKASNIVLSHNRLCLIDMDAAQAHSSKILFKRAHEKDRSRFMKNWVQHSPAYQTFKPLVVTGASPAV